MFSIFTFKSSIFSTVTHVGVEHAARLFSKKAVSVCTIAGVAQSPSEEYMRSLFEKTSSASEVGEEIRAVKKIYALQLSRINETN